MGMVALEQRIASAYVILFGVHGEITRQAQERGLSRQRVYREHAGMVTALAGTAWLQGGLLDPDELTTAAQRHRARYRGKLRESRDLDFSEPLCPCG